MICATYFVLWRRSCTSGGGRDTSGGREGGEWVDGAVGMTVDGEGGLTVREGGGGGYSSVLGMGATMQLI